MTSKAIYTLSEALVKSDELKIPNLRHNFINLTGKMFGNYYPSCAIGAAAQITGDFDGETETTAEEVTHITDKRILTRVDDALTNRTGGEPIICPVRGCEDYIFQIRDFIVHAYDDHRMSRTRIAARVEQLKAWYLKHKTLDDFKWGAL